MADLIPSALVTGGRRGIGRGCAYAMAEAGFNVVIGDLERCDQAEETLQGVRSRGREAAFVRCDVADLGSHERIVGEAFAAFGNLHCLINNAGVSAMKRGDILEMTVDSWDRCFTINVRGPFFLTQRIARRWLTTPPETGAFPRSVINVTSSNVTIVAPTRTEYAASKAAWSMATKGLAIRLANENIAVHEIRPGIIRSDMTSVSKDKYDKLIADGLSPMRRWGEPEDVGRACAVLAKGLLPFTVAQVIEPDGGLRFREL
jgi:3-oxoacyl-[acyl-carrier protein] reductase